MATDDCRTPRPLIQLSFAVGEQQLTNQLVEHFSMQTKFDAHAVSRYLLMHRLSAGVETIRLIDRIADLVDWKHRQTEVMGARWTEKMMPLVQTACRNRFVLDMLSALLVFNCRFRELFAAVIDLEEVFEFACCSAEHFQTIAVAYKRLPSASKNQYLLLPAKGKTPLFHLFANFCRYPNRTGQLSEESMLRGIKNAIERDLPHAFGHVIDRMLIRRSATGRRQALSHQKQRILLDQCLKKMVLTKSPRCFAYTVRQMALDVQLTYSTLTCTPSAQLKMTRYKSLSECRQVDEKESSWSTLLQSSANNGVEPLIPFLGGNGSAEPISDLPPEDPLFIRGGGYLHLWKRNLHKSVDCLSEPSRPVRPVQFGIYVNRQFCENFTHSMQALV